MSPDTLATLRQSLRSWDGERRKDLVTFGLSSIDEVLGGGIVRSALHDISAADATHIGAATGFASAFALKASQGKPILWARQDFLDAETGILNGSGLIEFGLDPARIFLVRARDIEGTLRAGEQAALCSSLGAVLIEPWGETKLLDFTVSRRLSLASAKSGVPIFMLRVNASSMQSAAATRWNVKSLPSRTLIANAPGLPAFELNLFRYRSGPEGHVWRVEWDRDRKEFQEWKRPDCGTYPGVQIHNPRSAQVR